MTTRRDFFTRSIALGAACISGSVPASDRTVSAAPPPVPLRMPVWIDGRGPLSFIIDTGASRSALAAHCLPELPRSTRREDQVRLQTPTGKIDVPTVAISNFATAAGAAATPSGPRRLPVLPRQALTSADGLLGADAMAGGRLHLDFVAGIAALSHASSTSAAASDRSGTAAQGRSRSGRPVEIAVELDAVHRAFVEVQVGPRRVRALLDTGALRSIALPALRIDAATAPPPAAGPSDLRGADGSLLAAIEATLPALRIGARRWPAGRVLVAPLPAAALTAVGETTETAMIFGLDRLAMLEWLTLDYARERLTLSPLRAGTG